MGAPRYARCEQCGSINSFDGAKGKRPVCGKCKKPLDPARSTLDKPVSVDDSTFQNRVIDAKIPVLVCFSAKWCGACRSIEPALNSVASRFKGKMKVTIMDVDASPRAANAFQIRATPTLIVFNGGQAVEQAVGALPEKELSELMARHIGV